MLWRGLCPRQSGEVPEILQMIILFPKYSWGSESP